MIIRAQNLVLPGAPDGNAPVMAIQNFVTTSNVTSSHGLPAYPATNVATPDTYLEWRVSPATLVLATLTVDLGDPGQAVNYIAIAGHNTATRGAAIDVIGSTDGSTFSVIPGTIAFTPETNGPIMFLFTTTLYRKIRVRWLAGSEAVRCAVLMTGIAQAMPQKIYVGHSPINLNRQTIDKVAFSEKGNYLGSVTLGETTSTEIALTDLNPQWYRGNFEPFLREARLRPFFFGWRPGTYPRDVGYVKLVNSPQPVNQRGNGMMQVSMTVAGVA